MIHTTLIELQHTGYTISNLTDYRMEVAHPTKRVGGEPLVYFPTFGDGCTCEAAEFGNSCKHMSALLSVLTCERCGGQMQREFAVDGMPYYVCACNHAVDESVANEIRHEAKIRDGRIAA